MESNLFRKFSSCILAPFLLYMLTYANGVYSDLFLFLFGEKIITEIFGVAPGMNDILFTFIIRTLLVIYSAIVIYDVMDGKEDKNNNEFIYLGIFTYLLLFLVDDLWGLKVFGTNLLFWGVVLLIIFSSFVIQYILLKMYKNMDTLIKVFVFSCCVSIYIVWAEWYEASGFFHLTFSCGKFSPGIEWIIYIAPLTIFGFFVVMQYLFIKQPNIKLFRRCAVFIFCLSQLLWWLFILMMLIQQDFDLYVTFTALVNQFGQINLIVHFVTLVFLCYEIKRRIYRDKK